MSQDYGAADMDFAEKIAARRTIRAEAVAAADVADRARAEADALARISEAEAEQARAVALDAENEAAAQRAAPFVSAILGALDEMSRTQEFIEVFGLPVFQQHQTKIGPARAGMFYGFQEEWRTTFSSGPSDTEHSLDVSLALDRTERNPHCVVRTRPPGASFITAMAPPVAQGFPATPQEAVELIKTAVADYIVEQDPPKPSM